MAFWIDTHCHLDAPEFAACGGPQRVREEARAAGVGRIVIPAVDAGNFAAVRELAHRTGDGYALGFHPLYLPQGEVAEALGWGVSALVEVSLDMQTQEALDAFEALVVADAQVQQCWRVSPGPDFVLVVQVPDMPAYQALAQRLFTAHHQVRNVRAFFAVKRAKFGSQIPLPPA